MTNLDEVYLNIDWPADRPFQVIGFGLNAVDWICVLPHYPRHDTKVQIEQMYRLKGGGEVATASALCARYGLKVRYIGRVGDDEMGRFCLKDLRKEPMDTSCVEVIAGAFSQFAIIMVDRPTGERTILWDRDPKLRYTEEGLKRDWIVQGQILHLDGHDQAASIQAARWAHEEGAKVCLDVDKFQAGVEKLLALSDFVFPTLDFVRQFSGKKNWREGLLQVSETTSGLTGVTRGKRGSAVVWEGAIVEVPGIEIRAVDTTGAGDIFHGAFVYSLFQDWSLQRCLRFANTAGALAYMRYGAREGIAQLEEVLRKM